MRLVRFAQVSEGEMTQGHKRKVLGDETGDSSAFEYTTEESSEGEGEDTCSEVEQKGEKGGKEERQHVCPFAGCGAVFKKVGKLNRHISTHTGEVCYTN